MSTTVTITAQQVNELRKLTGAGIMDCKKALVEASGDIQEAINNLRKKGAKVASSRAEREANEGVVIAKTTEDAKKGVAIMLNCETDFVANNSDYLTLANAILEAALSSDAATVSEVLALHIGSQSIEELIIEKIGVIGEKLELAKFGVVKAEKVAVYIHGNRKASLVGFNSADITSEISKDVAMHIVAMNPIVVDKDNVDTTTLERELEIGREQARTEGKAEDMIEKIAQGKLNRFYKDSTLLNQEYMNDDKKTVGQFLTSIAPSLTVTEFYNFSLAK